jgi:glycerol-3-phosphate acyltransferase PlsY
MRHRRILSSFFLFAFSYLLQLLYFSLSLQRYALDIDVAVEEDGGTAAEDVHRLGGEKSATSFLCTEGVHFGVASHVIGEASSYVLTLHDNFDVLGSVLAYFVVDDRVMCATEDDGVNMIILGY